MGLSTHTFRCFRHQTRACLAVGWVFQVSLVSFTLRMERMGFNSPPVNCSNSFFPFFLTLIFQTPLSSSKSWGRVCTYVPFKLVSWAAQQDVSSKKWLEFTPLPVAVLWQLEIVPLSNITSESGIEFVSSLTAVGHCSKPVLSARFTDAVPSHWTTAWLEKIWPPETPKSNLLVSFTVSLSKSGISVFVGESRVLVIPVSGIPLV